MASRRQRKARAAKQSESKWKKRLVYPAMVLGFLCVIGPVWAYRAVKNYLRSDEFRVMLTEEGSNALEREVKIEPLEWDGWTARSEQLQVHDTNEVQKITLHSLRANIDASAVFDGKYRLKFLSLNELFIEADLAKPVGPPPPKYERKKSLMTDYLPQSYEVDRMEIARLHGRILADEREWIWDDTRAVITSGSGKDVYDISLHGGTLQTGLALIPEGTLAEAQARYADGRLYLLDAKVRALENAHLDLSGEYALASKSWKMKGQLANAQCEELLAENWKQRLKGELQSEFSFRSIQNENAVLTGELKIENGVLTALPILDRIAAYTNKLRFRRLVLSEAELKFRQENHRIELSEIVLASEGLVRLTGDMTIEGNRIQKGRFRLGLTPGTLAHIPGAETKVFQRGEGGLLWSNLIVSGTLDDPKEDLSDRLIAAAGERMLEQVAGGGKAVLQLGGKIIDGSVDHILKKGDSVSPDAALKAGTDVITEGVGRVFDLLGSPLKEEE